jgi:NAD(P)-dependent dehydrogenase (short-subunit alcohol dehydrogenase family)
MELTGKTAVVTGGASGIGLALATRFATEGMNVVIADVEEEALEGAVAGVGAKGNVLCVVVDVTDAGAVDRLRADTIDRFGVPFVVCNNAGVGGLGDMTFEGPLSGWDWVLGVNFYGVLHGVRAFVPLMVEAGQGHVVNTASLAALGSIPGMGPYCASKHAVLALSESLHAELAMAGSAVQVHVLCPGFLRTRIHESKRNWLAKLGEEPADKTDEMALAMRQLLDDLVTSGLEPAELVDALLDAMEAGRFFVTTHPEQAEQMMAQRAATVAGSAPELPVLA